MRSATISLLIFIIIILPFACTTKPKSAQNSPSPQPVSTPSKPGGHVSQPGEREFIGLIGNNKIKLYLAKVNRTFKGAYLYEKIGTELKLDGEMQPNNNIIVKEYDPKGQITGSFDFVFFNDDWIEGTWTAAKGKKSLPFTAWIKDRRDTPVLDDTDKVSGEYQRYVNGKPDTDGAGISLWLMKDGQVRIVGDAVWIGANENVHVGDIGGFFPINGDEIIYQDNSEGLSPDDRCYLKIKVIKNGLTVSDDNLRCGGLNVTFDGDYKKIGPPVPPIR